MVGSAAFDVRLSSKSGTIADIAASQRTDEKGPQQNLLRTVAATARERDL
jgi:hypothetical protein